MELNLASVLHQILCIQETLELVAQQVHDRKTSDPVRRARIHGVEDSVRFGQNTWSAGVNRDDRSGSPRRFVCRAEYPTN